MGCKTSSYWVPIVLALALCACSGGGGGGGSSSGTNSTATIQALAPTTVEWNSAAFTLTVTGSGFDQSSVVQWNGYPRSTTYVSSEQLTAKIAATDTLQSGTASVTVTGSAGGTSNAVSFSIPCVLASLGAASAQTTVNLGAIYFDGWAGPLDSYHLKLLVDTPYQDREPLSGWRDDNSCAVEQQLAWARSFGVNFFLFDWYFNASVYDAQGNENLNSALQITHALPDRHGMQYAILYVDQDPFTITNSTDWTSAVTEWVGYMTDPAYLKVNGEPLLMVINMRGMRQAFGSSQAVNAAFSQLRAAAKKQGLAGVYIIGGMDFAGGPPVPAGTPSVDGIFPDLSIAVADGYDAVSMYDYASGLLNLGTIAGLQPFSTLGDTANWLWTEASSKSPLPFIPVVMPGSDARPQPPPSPSTTFWVNPSPQDAANLVMNAITWAETNPMLRPEPGPAAPMVLISAWNELLGGGYLIPTVGYGTSFGDALAASLAAPPTKTGTILTLNDSGPSGANRMASGKLTDANGAALADVAVSLTYLPLINGSVSTYQLSGLAPASAVQATVGFRINTNDPVALWPGYWFAGPTASSISVYQFSYIESGNPTNLISNGNFATGGQAWTLGGQSQIVPSDQGGGQMVQVTATAAQPAMLDSLPFPVTGGDSFQIAISARIPPASTGSGYFVVAFKDNNGNFVPLPGPNPNDLKSETIPFTEAPLAVGTATTDPGGNLSLSLTAFGSQQLLLEGTYAGDAQHWPAYVQVSP